MSLTKVFKLGLSVCGGLLLSLCLGACKANAPVSGNVNQSVNATPTPEANTLAEAEKLYAGRAEDLARVRSAIIMLRADNANYEAAWRLAKYNYYLGDNSKDEAEQTRAFADGVQAGQQAAKLQPDKPEGHFWLGANLGGQARASVLSGMTSVDDIRREMKEVIRVDEGFQGGAAYLALGQSEMELPTMMGGDPKKAIEYLEKGEKLSATNALTRYWLAKAYLATGRKAEAKAKLEEIAKMTPDPEYIPEHNKTKADAETLLKEEFGGK